MPQSIIYEKNKYFLSLKMVSQQEHQNGDGLVIGTSLYFKITKNALNCIHSPICANNDKWSI